jgi:hypothetical protein
MNRWRYVVAGVAVFMSLGCIGPLAGVGDDALTETPVDYDRCCAGADRAQLGKLAGRSVTAVAPDQGVLVGDTYAVRIDAVVTTPKLDPKIAGDVDWDDDDRLIAPDDRHEYVLFLVTRASAASLAGVTVKNGPEFAISVYRDAATLVRTCAPASAAPSVSPSCGPTSQHTMNPLLKSSDGSFEKSMILVIRVPVGETVLFTTAMAVDQPLRASGGDQAAVDLRTGRRTQYPRRTRT